MGRSVKPPAAPGSWTSTTGRIPAPRTATASTAYRWDSRRITPRCGSGSGAESSWAARERISWWKRAGSSPWRTCAPGSRSARRTASVSRLTVLDVAHPCRPFTAWALGGLEESHVLKDHLQFLDGGMRGFYCLGVASGTVSVGDRVVLL